MANLEVVDVYLGFDIGGTKCTVILGNGTGCILCRAVFPTHAERGPMPIVEELCETAGRLLREHQPSSTPVEIAAAGVAIGGPLDSAAGIVLSPPNLPGWDHLPLAELLRRRLGLQRVRLEHDAAACAMAEYRWGAGQGARRLIYLTCGTGFGAGFVIDGIPYRGAGGQNMEIGHVRYRPDGPIAFAKAGSFEAYCAGGSLGRLAAYLFPARWNQSPPGGAELSTLARAGDADARHVLMTNAQATGDACALLGDLLRPEMILLGSLARHLGDWWVSAVQARFSQEALPATASRCPIQPSALGERLAESAPLAVATMAA